MSFWNLFLPKLLMTVACGVKGPLGEENTAATKRVKVA